MPLFGLNLLTEPNFNIGALPIKRISEGLNTLLIPRELSIDVIEV